MKMSQEKNKNVKNNIETFLNPLRVASTDSPFNYISMADDYKGSFYLDKNQIKEFTKLYTKAVENGVVFSIGEKPKDYGPLLIDLDIEILKEDYTGERLYNNEMIFEIIDAYRLVSNDYLNLSNKELAVALFEKPQPTIKKDKIKDGVHLIFQGVVVHYKLRFLIRDKVIKLLTGSELFKKYNVEKLLDKQVINANCWLLPGSKKPDGYLYELKTIYDINNNPIDITNILSDKYKLINQFSLQHKMRCEKNKTEYLEGITTETINEQFSKLGDKKTEAVKPAEKEKTVDDINKSIECCLLCLPIENNNDFNEKWRDIALIINNELGYSGLDVLLKWSSDGEGYNKLKVEQFYKSIKPKENGLKIGTLKKMAKESNPELYKKLFSKKKEKKEPDMTEIKYIAKSDDEASLIVYNLLKDRLFYYKGKMFLKVVNIWMCEQQFIDSYIFNFISELNIYKIIDGLDLAVYSSNVSGSKAIQKLLFAKVMINTDNNILYEKFHSTTKNRICFKDGVLDFKEKKFYLWSEIDFEYYSCVMINRNYNEYFKNPNRDVINIVKEKVFENMYADKTDSVLHFLSRAITGNYEDKNFLLYLGNRNCGKGVQYEALKAAFESYVNTFELGNVLYNRKSAGMENVDCSKKLYWLLDFEFVRFGVSQEVPDPKAELKVNGKIWKKINGGGDEIVARRNYDKVDSHITIETTFAVYGNNSLIFDSDDCLEHALKCSSVNQFKTEEEIEKYKSIGTPEIELKRYKVKDGEIKTICKSVEWSDAIVYLLFENYKNYAVKIEKEESEEEITLISKIKEHFTFTYNKDDKLVCQDVYSIIGEDKGKIDTELKSVNIFKSKCKSRGDFRDKWCFYGIKSVNDDDDEDKCGLDAK